MINDVSEPFTDAINLVANAELKALSYMGLVDLECATSTAVGTHIDEHLGLTDSGAKGYAIPLETNGFASSQMLESDYNARIVRKFSPERLQVAIPAIGAMLGWSARHDESLRLFLGASSSNSGVHGPSTSLTVLEQLAKGTRGTADIDVPTYQENEALNGRLRSLLADEVVTPDEDINRTTINNPEYIGRIGFERLKPETQHLYSLLQQLKAQDPDRAWNPEELIDLAARTYHSDQPKDPRVFRSLVLNAVKNTHVAARNFPGVMNRIDVVKNPIMIAPDHADAAADLVETASKLQATSGEMRFQALATDMAYDIYFDVDTASTLAQKDIDSSSYRR